MAYKFAAAEPGRRVCDGSGCGLTAVSTRGVRFDQARAYTRRTSGNPIKDKSCLSVRRGVYFTHSHTRHDTGYNFSRSHYNVHCSKLSTVNYKYIIEIYHECRRPKKKK